MDREPPKELADKANFDDELFTLCRNDDYAGLYRVFVERYGHSIDHDE